MRLGTRIINGLLALSLAACGDGAGPGGNTSMSVLLKDAPGDLKKAVVTIDQIYLQGSSKVVLSSTPVTVDLLTLASSTASLVQGAAVPSGSYTELRFVVSGGYVEVDNGDGTTSIYASSASYAGLPAGTTVTGALQMPSLAQSGLKIDFGGSSSLDVTGTQKIVVVDFDVSQSFGHVAGGSTQWVMHPVIKGADATVTGSVRATVQLGQNVTLPAVNGGQLTLANFSATLTSTADNSATTVALVDAGNGAFRADFAYVAPGGYTVSLALPPGVTSVTTQPASPAAVTVSSNAQAAVNLTVSAVQ